MNAAASLLYFMSSSVLLAVLLGFLRGSLDTASAVASLVGGGLVGVVSFLRAKREPLRLPRRWEWLAVGLFGWFAVRAFWWLVTVEGDEIKTVVWNNGGDLSLHLCFINYFAGGTPFWPESPIFAGGQLTYSAGVDLFNSLLVLAGMDVFRSLVWVGFVCCILTGIALWRWGGAFTLAGFLCNGGLAALALLLPYSAALVLTGNPVGFPQREGWPALVEMQGNLAWKSIPLTMFITQRGFLYALPAGLLLLCSWRSRFFTGDGWRMPFLGELLLYAALPFFHIHSFLALSFLLAAFFLARAAARKALAALVLAALLPASGLVYLTLGQLRPAPAPMWGDMSQFENPPPAQRSKVLGWQPGWMVDEEPTPATYTALTGDTERSGLLARLGQTLVFWAVNFGILPLLVLAVLVVLLRGVLRKNVRYLPALGLAVGAAVLFAALAGWEAYASGTLGLLRADSLPLLLAGGALLLLLARLARDWQQPLWPSAFVLPALFLFFLCCNVKFAPWAWDNTKIMIWAYLIVLPFVWELVLVRWPFWPRVVALELLFFSGFLTLFAGLKGDDLPRTIAHKSELAMAAEAVRDIPITAKFVIEPEPNHPLLLLGRKVIVGYPGHIWSHGLKADKHTGYADAILNGFGDWRLLSAEMGARYLYWGRMERAKHDASYQAWRDSALRIFADGEIELFDLETPPAE